jgi:IS605 OrfB family transposase
MQRTIKLLLKPTKEQAELLKVTLEQNTACYNYVTEKGFSLNISNGVTLHKETYYPLREKYPNLPSDIICQARVKATGSLKSVFTSRRKGKKVSCPKGYNIPIPYRQEKTYRLLLKDSLVSLATIKGRIKVPFYSNTYTTGMFNKAVNITSANLVYKKNILCLHVAIELPSPLSINNNSVVGIDLGINRPAVTSTKQFIGKKRWKAVDKKYFNLKRKLQSKGTKSAKRHLKKLSGKVRRFRLDCDHVVSKHIVNSVPFGTTIVLENLTNIRKTAKQRKGKQNRKLHSWSFTQLKSFIEYKAEEKGCKVVTINPAYTSQTCSRCGYVSRSNRKTQAIFKCRKCNYQLNADLNAAINIANKHTKNGITILSGQ